MGNTKKHLKMFQKRLRNGVYPVLFYSPGGAFLNNEPMDPSIPNHLIKAYHQCEKQAFSHYENFPVASLLLPKENRPHVAALYAFARTADDFADEDRFEGRRIPEINRWERGLKNALKGKEALPVLQAFAHTLKAFQIPVALPLALLRAFRMDALGHRYSTWNSLLYYCRHSANPVGRIVLYIFGIREEKLHRYSDYICGGLQLINFWQDTSVDMKRGRVYYPRSEWKKAGVAEKDLLNLRWTPSTRRLVEGAVNYTQAYFQKGFPLLNALEGRLKWEIKATCLGGAGILKKIRRMDYNVFQRRPFWNKWEMLSLALRALMG
jgi:squalene synthase HpnC